MGLHRAGFEVVGVDVKPQPSYPFEFHQADWLDFVTSGDPVGDPMLEFFDFVWASPPCQAHTQLRGLGKAKPDDVDLLPPVRSFLRGYGIPHVIENVVGAKLIEPITLCGSMFGLAVRRHRLFECHGFTMLAPECRCRGRRNIAVYGKSPAHRLPDGVIRARDLAHGRAAMGIDWMEWRELTQAIPPAYGEFIGKAALRAMREAAE